MLMQLLDSNYAFVILHIIMGCIKFCQINAHKAKKCLVEIEKRHEHAVNFVSAVSEPYCRNRKVEGLDFGNLFSYGESPRSAIVADPSLNIWGIPEFSEKDITTVCMKTDNTKIYICSAYMPIEQKINDIIINLVKYCKDKLSSCQDVKLS